MRFRDWFRPPRHVLTIFASVAVVCGLALAWLGWLLLEQDNVLEAQRRRDAAADHAVAAMQRSLAELQSQLDSLAESYANCTGARTVPDRGRVSWLAR